MNLTIFAHGPDCLTFVNLLIRLKNKIPYALHILSNIVNPSWIRKILKNSCSVPVDSPYDARVSLTCEAGVGAEMPKKKISKTMVYVGIRNIRTGIPKS